MLLFKSSSVTGAYVIETSWWVYGAFRPVKFSCQHSGITQEASWTNRRWTWTDSRSQSHPADAEAAGQRQRENSCPHHQCCIRGPQEAGQVLCWDLNFSHLRACPLLTHACRFNFLRQAKRVEYLIQEPHRSLFPPQTHNGWWFKSQKACQEQQLLEHDRMIDKCTFIAISLLFPKW